MIYSIDIPEPLNATLIEKSGQNSLSPEIYANNIVLSWLEGQYRAKIFDELKVKKIEDLASIDLATIIKDAKKK